MNLEINYSALLSKKVVSSSDLLISLEKYVSENKMVSWKGCLYNCGVTSHVWRTWKHNTNSKSSKVRNDAELCLLYLERFRMALEMKLEEYLIYQSQHPDLENRLVNYKSLQ